MVPFWNSLEETSVGSYMLNLSRGLMGIVVELGVFSSHFLRQLQLHLQSR